MSPVRTLTDLIAEADLDGAELVGPGDVAITGITIDSRRVEPGWLFCCVPGAVADGHRFAGAAIAAGAAALLVERYLDPASHPDIDPHIAQLIVPSVRAASGPLAAALHGNPSRRLTMIGVTGTNGKTTVTSLIAAILEHAGIPCGVIGTLTGTHTTPEAPDLQAQLASFADRGRRAVVMEVSSHALALHRVVGCRFDVAVFTNLGRDHLDLHGTMERYFAAKASLFRAALTDRGVVNVGDVHGRLLADGADIAIETFSDGDADDVQIGVDRLRFRWRGVPIVLAMGGHFNVTNAVAAATACAALGIEAPQIAAGLATVSSVPGRFEAIHAGQPFTVVVDFAHTPEGLDAALGAARAASAGASLLVVFGAGGDRDPDKRPLMGTAASRWADVIVVTSDNPRSEAPERILDDILQGVPGDYRGLVIVEPDRRQALAKAFAAAAPGDVVIIAGKGHETTQTVGNKVYEFDDRAVARELLEVGR